MGVELDLNYTDQSNRFQLSVPRDGAWHAFMEEFGDLIALTKQLQWARIIEAPPEWGLDWQDLPCVARILALSVQHLIIGACVLSVTIGHDRASHLH